MTNVVLEPVDTFTVTGNREYDYLTPGSGLLIWHVDEGVAGLDYVTDDDIPNNFQANTLQWDSQRRFVRLIEADGLINFGGFFSAGTGTSADYFFFPNNAELSAFTNPPASSNTGAPTGITINNISRPGNSMTIDVSREGPLAGFPVFAGIDSTSSAAPVVIDVDRTESGWRFPGDGSPEVLTGYKNYICGWDWDGHALDGHAIIDTTHRYDDSLVIRTLFPLAAGDLAGDGWVAPPLVADGGDGVAMIVAIANGGETYIWETTDQDHDGLLDVEFTRHIASPPTGPPMVLNRGGSTKEVFIPVAGGRYVTIGLLSGDSSLSDVQVGEIMGAAGLRKDQLAATFRDPDDMWSIGWVDGPSVEMGDVGFLPPVVGDIDRDSSLDAVFLDREGHLFVIDADAQPVAGFPIDLRLTPTQPPVLGDLDMDGYLDVLVVAEGYAYAYAHNGALLPDFPVLLGERSRPDSGATSPAIAALSGGGLSLVTSGWRQLLTAYDGDGSVTETFPHPLGAVSNVPVAWGVNTDINRSGIFARCEDGYLYGFDAPTPAAAIGPIWPMARRDARATATIPVEDLLPLNVNDLFFTEERTFVYPSPASGYAVVRYWLGDDADVRIRIFDIAGNLVTEADGPGKGGLYNEWTWDCSNAASGVYFAHVEANQLVGGRKETVLCKMAVVQ